MTLLPVLLYVSFVLWWSFLWCYTAGGEPSPVVWPECAYVSVDDRDRPAKSLVKYDLFESTRINLVGGLEHVLFSQKYWVSNNPN